MVASDTVDDDLLLRSLPECWYWLYSRRREAAEEELVYAEEAAAEADGVVAIRRSLPRPLIPLLEFLYSEAKYSQSSLSSRRTGSPGLMQANFWVRKRRVGEWNLFWWD